MLRKNDKIQIFGCGIIDRVQMTQDMVQLWSLFQRFRKISVITK